ncbi:Superoxide dismutase [Cu-Zn] [Tephrocybe rancida]|nr:Superoxide dismutase [Cu-Zn] [Tephrocybe rancida]
MNSFADLKFSPPKPTKSFLPRFLQVTFFIFALIYAYMLYSVWTWTGTYIGPLPFDKAVVILSGPLNITGTVTFYQARGRGPVTVSGSLQNLDPEALRGFHIHQFGDLTQGCLTAGPHFNPYGQSHGAPTDKIRHVGDLGNVKSEADGSSVFTFEDSQLTLNGPQSIIGRAVVLHAGTDDLGHGGDEESLKTGNAGARAACGVIGISA